jgi:hypothetical protein
VDGLLTLVVADARLVSPSLLGIKCSATALAKSMEVTSQAYGNPMFVVKFGQRPRRAEAYQWRLFYHDSVALGDRPFLRQID